MSVLSLSLYFLISIEWKTLCFLQKLEWQFSVNCNTIWFLCCTDALLAPSTYLTFCLLYCASTLVYFFFYFFLLNFDSKNCKNIVVSYVAVREQERGEENYYRKFKIKEFFLVLPTEGKGYKHLTTTKC